MEEFAEEVENILLQVEDGGQTEATIFYDPNQNYNIEYWADNETAGYSSDTHIYQLGILVDWKDDND
jgi:hypothetical protein